MERLPPRVRAVLGPTNTGKTHLAMERLLGHASGIIGFPLRLLARENYDRMVARKGAQHVALITGEEKIVPPGARWFSCTVEAMPLDRHAEFVAVDEIQLCADPDRGHVFTDRLLHARGLVETMFLGADTIRPLLHRLVRQVEIDARPRMSRLSCSGPQKLTRLPPRSAIVAFSAGEVYAAAELVRRRRGGCAVVMGRLSPRTRNAQVALYQNKEVDFLVATDAIGMGLNMDVDHVAFAGLYKFDGHRPRPLSAPEVAQIAGRAGRGMRDGTFGTTGTCPPLDDDLIEDVEAHRFEPLEQIFWRNASLDFASVDGLLASLQAMPPRPGLVRGNDAADLQTLAALSRDAEVAPLAHGRTQTRLLWDACQIPDFRKYADDSHVRLCGRVFTHLVRDGVLPEDWIAGQIAALARPDGDIDTLMQRLAGVRVWTYVAARADWLRDATHWQARARAVEDVLSDALHERLTTRFVDRRVAHLMRTLDTGERSPFLAAVTAQGEVVVEGHTAGRIRGFAFAADAVDSEDRKLVLRAARRALLAEMPRRVARLEQAADTALRLMPSGDVTWDGVVVARLRPGVDALHPAVDVPEGDFLDGALRERVRVRLHRFVAAQVAEILAPLLAACAAAASDPALRGPMHVLREGLGVAPGVAGDDLPRGRLKAAGVTAGRFALFMPAVLRPRPAALRALLWSVWQGIMLPFLPVASMVSLPPPGDWPENFGRAQGWVTAGPVLLRLDVAEKLAAELSWRSRGRVVPLPPGLMARLASRLAVRAALLPAVLHGLGVRLVPAEALAPDQFGPPDPAGMAMRLRTEPRPDAAAVPRDGPFSALSVLRR